MSSSKGDKQHERTYSDHMHDRAGAQYDRMMDSGDYHHEVYKQKEKAKEDDKKVKSGIISFNAADAAKANRKKNKRDKEDEKK